MLTADNSNIFTVTRLNGAVRQLLEKQMGRLWLTAEISNFSRPASGHWYFTLKDDGAQVRCAMFRNSNQRVSFRPENGTQVLVRASVTLYDPRGDYQLIVESMQPAGEGLLQQKFQAVKLKLEAEGLFDARRKQPLPQPAQCVGVITSASGAALHDILQVLRRRDPGLPIIIYPTLVQGNEATSAIVQAIQLANQRQECDVLIVGRGGGSLEDLWCFNEEAVARAIAASQIAIISAVGHETDITIADFVADLRAPTPSAAAELVSRNQQELQRQLVSAQQHLALAWDHYFSRQQRHYTLLQHRLTQQHPQLRLNRQQQQLMLYQRRLQDAVHQQLQKFLLQQQRLTQRLQQRQPQPQIYQLRHRLEQYYYRLTQGIQQQLSHQRQQFSYQATSLQAVSPLATLGRGYSVTTRDNGAVVKQLQDAAPGECLRTRVKDGWLESEVTKQIKLPRQGAKRVSGSD